jgi:hypothetical protein
MKLELGKSSSSCKASLVVRLNRKAALQEFWCASFEELCVYENLAAHPDVIGFAEQLTRVPFENINGERTHTLIDVHVLLRNQDEILVSVKYDEKARRASYLAQVEGIARQTPRSFADRLTVLSRFSFHPGYRACTKHILRARHGWDPQADEAVLAVAAKLPERFTFGDLLERAGLGSRGYRAAVRLIGDGDLRKHLLDPFAPDTTCWRSAG